MSLGEYTTALSDATSRAASGARAWPRAVRWLAAVLVAVSRASLPTVATAALTGRSDLLEPGVLAPLLGMLALLPAVAARALASWSGAALEIAGADLVIRRHTQRIDVPLVSIARVEPWGVPLPGVGFDLRLASGRRLGVGIESRDPVPLLDALGAAGVASARSASAHPALVFASARAGDPGERLRRPLWKFGVFSLAPTAVMFNAHQHIAYGGSLGQLHLEGLGPYLATFGFYWGTIVLYLLLYASLWRALAEAAAWLAAHVCSARAAAVRRVVERIALAAYYAGVPALVALRFLA